MKKSIIFLQELTNFDWWMSLETRKLVIRETFFSFHRFSRMKCIARRCWLSTSSLMGIYLFVLFFVTKLCDFFIIENVYRVGIMLRSICVYLYNSICTNGPPYRLLSLENIKGYFNVNQDVKQLTEFVDVKKWLFGFIYYYHFNPFDVNSLPETDNVII